MVVDTFGVREAQLLRAFSRSPVLLVPGPKPTSCRVLLPPPPQALPQVIRLDEALSLLLAASWDLRHPRRPVFVVLGPERDQ